MRHAHLNLLHPASGRAFSGVDSGPWPQGARGQASQGFTWAYGPSTVWHQNSPKLESSDSCEWR